MQYNYGMCNYFFSKFTELRYAALKVVCIYIAVLFVFLSFVLGSCKGNGDDKTVSVSDNIGSKAENSNDNLQKDVKAVLEKEPPVTIYLPLEKKAPKARAHQKYLNDKLIFMPLSQEEFKTEKTAVVGSKVCMFYPLENTEIENIKSNADLKKLPKGIPVPFSTIIPILGEPVKSAADEEDDTGFFEFQDNVNLFYKTELNGKTGLVFGADLILNEDLKMNKIISMLYKTNGRPSEFYPICGFNYLSALERNMLEEKRLIFQNVNKKEYGLDSFSPDDMISLYQNHLSSIFKSDYKEDPVFITTDLIVHSQHLVFDRLLQYCEETFFMPKLETLVTLFLKDLEKVNTSSAITAKEETLEKAKLYFLTAQALLKLSGQPKKGEDKYGNDEIIYEEPDKETVLKEYPDKVRKEIELIYGAEGLMRSEIFTFADKNYMSEDYSQYKPRGHYTKNKKLEAYFRAMMWFGHIHFLIADKGPKVLSQNGQEASWSEDLTMNMEPIALLITETVKNNEKLYTEWCNLFEPITALIGLSDDLSFKEVLPLWGEYNVKNFKEWSSDKKNLIAFMKDAHKKLKPPAIAGSSVFYSPSEGTEEERRPPMGWRLFGQRFVLDSFIHHSVSAPRLTGIDENGNNIGRGMVSGLDIMKALGSKAADFLLQDEYRKFKLLKPILDGFERAILSNPEKVLGHTYYSRVLNGISLLAQFEQGAGFYFTETPEWNRKSLLSAHGAWAELRHDTILYAKMSGAEYGGGYDEEATFRTEEVPHLVHYIEPNLPFFKNTANSIGLLSNVLGGYGLIDESVQDILKNFETLCKKAAEIVELEIQDKPVSKEDIKWIASIPFELVRIVLIAAPSGSELDENLLKSALVADVFTNHETGTALETATGIPYRIYVPLNDAQGGKRVAVGYCFNYYEFKQPVYNRLNDEQWKEKVYTDNFTDILEDSKPDWAKNIALPAKD